MTTLEWDKHSVEGDFVRKLRREIHMYRREKGRAGKEFSPDDLRTVWASGSSYVVLTHNTDRAWQFWWKHPEKGWFLQSWHRLLSEAKEEAEKPRITDLPENTAKISGLYVCAEWEGENRFAPRPIIVLCSSQGTASDFLDVFQKLGYRAAIKTVA